MRLLRYSINVTMDGCVHHGAGLPPDEESMRYWTAQLERADALLFGRVTFQMMESVWRKPADGIWPSWISEQQVPFAETMHQAKKYVVSSSPVGAGWNAEVVPGDLEHAVLGLKHQPGDGLWVGGVTLPRALAELESGALALRCRPAQTPGASTSGTRTGAPGPVPARDDPLVDGHSWS